MTKDCVKQLKSEAAVRNRVMGRQKQLSNDLRSYIDKIRALLSNNAALQRDIAILESQDKQSLQELEEVITLRKNAESENDSIVMEIQQQESELSKSLSLLDQRKTQKEEVINEMLSLQTNLEMLKKKLKNDSLAFGNQKSNSASELSELRARVEALEARNTEMIGEIAEKKQLLEDAQVETVKLETEFNSLQEDMLRASAELIQTKERLPPLKEECGKLREAVPLEIESKELQLSVLREDLARNEEEEKVVDAELTQNQHILQQLQDVVLPDLQAQALNAKASCQRQLKNNVVTISPKLIESILVTSHTEILKSLIKYKELLPSTWESLLSKFQGQPWTTVALNEDELDAMDGDGNVSGGARGLEGTEDTLLHTPPGSPLAIPETEPEVVLIDVSEDVAARSSSNSGSRLDTSTRGNSRKKQSRKESCTEGEDIHIPEQSPETESSGSHPSSQDRDFEDIPVLSNKEWDLFVYSALRNLVPDAVTTHEDSRLMGASKGSEDNCRTSNDKLKLAEWVHAIFESLNKLSIDASFISNVNRIRTFSVGTEITKLFQDLVQSFSEQFPELCEPFLKAVLYQKTLAKLREDIVSLEKDRKTLNIEVTALEKKGISLTKQMSSLAENMAQKIHQKEQELEQKLRELYSQTDAEELEARKVIEALQSRLKQTGYSEDRIQQGQSDAYQTFAESSEGSRMEPEIMDESKKEKKVRERKRQGGIESSVPSSKLEKENPFDFDGVLSTAPVRLNPQKSRRARR